MHLSRSGHTFAARRLVALAVIVAIAIGLGLLRLAPGPSRLGIPPGAHAGELALKPCTYETEAGNRAAECGTLVVPENRTAPASRLIALPVTRIKATSPTPGAPIFRLEGGPGKTDMQFRDASRFTDEHDVVLVGYRGVDGSVRLDCPEVEAAHQHASDVLGEQAFRAAAGAYRACADRLTAGGVDVTRYGLTQQVDDFEAARVALGYDRIDLLSESAGTRTALIYAWRYPNSLHRSVMIGANPPGNFLWDAATTDELIGRYAALCAADSSCSKRTDDLAAAIQRTSAHLPDHWFFLPIKKSNARIISFFGLMESTTKLAPASAPMTLDAWLAAGEGDTSGLWFASLAGDLLFPKMFVWGQYAAAARPDAQAGRAYFAPGSKRDANLGYAATAYGWGGGGLIDAWPAAPDEDQYSQMRPSDVETLLISGELDFATPPQIATRELLPYLPHGHQVVLRGFGHSGSFWADQAKAGSHLINTFFASGQVDDSLYTPAKIDFSPAVTDTLLAKIVFGSVVALAGLALLAVLGMAIRLWGRGAFGTKSSAALRSLLPVIVGLGGWCLGVLVVLVFWPAVPIDDPWLVVLAIGLPVGTGVALAWLDPSDRGTRKAAGLASAGAGALVGAWLGFHVTDGVLAVLTAIAASAAGANLALIGLDSWSSRAKRSIGKAPVVATAEQAPAQPQTRGLAVDYVKQQRRLNMAHARSVGSEDGTRREARARAPGGTGRIARVAARHPWKTLGLWVALVVLGFGAARAMNLAPHPTPAGTEATTAHQLIKERLRRQTPPQEFIVVESPTATTDQASFAAFVDALVADLKAAGKVQSVASYRSGVAGLVSADRHTALVTADLTGGEEQVAVSAKPLTAVVAAANGKEGFRVTTVGFGSVDGEINSLLQATLEHGELIGMAVALVVLLIVFGAAVAAGIPIVVALLSIAVAVGATALVSNAVEMSNYVVFIITMIGLAVGIDYSLFIVQRFREERAAGQQRVEAITRAGATASRAVLFSGMAVSIALGGMLIAPDPVFRSFAIGAMIVVAVTVLAALTLLPAVLALLGDRVNWLPLPLLGTRRGPGGTGGLSTITTRLVTARPVLSVVLSAGLLVAAAVPVFNIKLGTVGIGTLPAASNARHAFDVVNREFSTGVLTADIVVDAPNVNAPDVQSAIGNLAAALNSDGFFGASRVEQNVRGDLALVTVAMPGDFSSHQSKAALGRLRSTYIPAAFHAGTAKVFVGGSTAETVDSVQKQKDYLPFVFAFVLGLSVLLLLMVFRSIVVPLKAVAMNLLSVGAAYGILVLVFQHGVGARLLGFQTSPVIESWLPLFLFAILFGLSMDYHVFLLSRIKERYDETGENWTAVAYGLRMTATIITGAALIMVAVFAGMASGKLVIFQQVGFGLAVAILIDATIIRLVLVPASMELLGDWNWYFPRWLAWLPEVRVEGEPDSPAGPGDGAGAVRPVAIVAADPQAR
jgi:uncharacterized membrane protein YdfJ with MMPL/SSD domain/pimeloyl-ACP methyl ester carboxylesterase